MSTIKKLVAGVALALALAGAASPALAGVGWVVSTQGTSGQVNDISASGDATARTQ